MADASPTLRSIPGLQRAFRLSRLATSMLRRGTLSPLLFAPPGHFYSPLPNARDMRLGDAALAKRKAAISASIDLKPGAQLTMLEELARTAAGIPFAETPNNKFRYGFRNPYFSYGDGTVLYGMLHSIKPNRIVEVGSGYSSALMLDVNEHEINRSVELTFIEPYCERLNHLLRPPDRETCRIIEQRVQDVDPAVFQTLQAGDILFIDSSHVAKYGSDVLHLFTEIIPNLAAGVVIHVHDILWPFEYPQRWLRDGRAWNEAYMAMAFLQFNTEFEIFYFNDYMATEHRERVQELLPGSLTDSGFPMTPGNSSLWLRRRVAHETLRTPGSHEPI